MIKELFFKLVDLILIFKKDGILHETEYTDGTKCTMYRMSGTTYTCVGQLNKPQLGFFLPIKEAYCGDKNITKTFKHFAGPKCNHIPDTGYIFRIPKIKFKIDYDYPGIRLNLSRVYEKGDTKPIRTINIANQVSEYGAK